MQEMMKGISRPGDGRPVTAAAMRATGRRNSPEQWKSKTMVWAFIEPLRFGQFFPHGDWVGWEEDCEAYFQQTPPEFQGRFNNSSNGYRAFVSRKFKEEFGTIPRYDPPITPIEPHEVPTVYRTERRIAKLGSIVILTYGWLAVDQALKDIIERLEPGVHQFFPLKIVMTKKDTAYPEQYYLLVIGRFLDSFVPEQSAEESWKASTTDPFLWPHVYSREGYAGLAFSRDRIGSANLWRERQLRASFVCISDQLRAEISNAGLRVWKLYRMREV